MKTITPLRYPGGKARLAPALAAVMEANGIVEPTMAEPYAGAAGASLELLFGERVRSICINDLDYRIFSFWWSCLNRTADFLDRIETAKLSMREWRRQRDIYRSARRHKRVDVGFATFYLNRTNRSGILVNGGPIGGVKQTGKWGLDARFTRPTLIDRVARIAAYKERISISNLDAVAFVKSLIKQYADKTLFIYLDPPYYEKGADLYLSTYGHEDHVAVGKALLATKHSHWVMTYDDVPAIRKIYAKCQLWGFHLRYTAQHRREGDEVFIAPKGLLVPRDVLKAV
jgi:DNA adenine methylase